MKLFNPKFGDICENGWASDKNPHKRGIFVEMVGNHFRFTDGKGEFWETLGVDHKLSVVESLESAKLSEERTISDCLASAICGNYNYEKAIERYNKSLHNPADGIPNRNVFTYLTNLAETVKWIASQENLFFAECSQAEEIVNRCQQATATFLLLSKPK